MRKSPRCARLLLKKRHVLTLTPWFKFNNQIAWVMSAAAEKVITPFENLPAQRGVNASTAWRRPCCVFTGRKTDGLARIKNDAGADQSCESVYLCGWRNSFGVTSEEMQMRARPPSWRLNGGAIPSIIRKATRLRNPICVSFLLFAFTLTASRVLRPLVQMENAKERANDEFWARWRNWAPI